MTQTKILFICHGNICRSTMCEFVMKHLVAKQNLEDYFEISSAATSREEIGNDTDPRTKRKLDEEGIPYTKRAARQVIKADYDYYDLLICADDANVRNTTRICGGDPDNKIQKLLEYAGSSREIADPWYTHNFDITFDDVMEGCEALLVDLIEEAKPTHLDVLPDEKKVRAFFTYKYEAVEGAPYNNPKFLEHIGLDYDTIVWPKQVHKDNIEIISNTSITCIESKKLEITIPETDGAITDVAGVLLTTVHADCLPVYFYDSEHEAIGLVHAGWRGTNLGIAAKCVRLMTEEYSTNPNTLKVYIGPGISQCCFEVGSEVKEEFAQNWNFADEYAIAKGDKFFLDIKGINKRQLIETGVSESNIQISEHCTYHEPELFASYRREGGTYMRMGAGICLLK